MRQPAFLYFDLGNVLVTFDDRRSCRQMGEVAGALEERVWEIIFGGDLKRLYETGEIDDRQFHDILCAETGSSPSFEALRDAGCDIFAPNASIFPVVAGLTAARYRLGILSNTCPAHWNYCFQRYTLLRRSFEVHALSYKLRACKPSAEIFERAAALTGVRPEEIFFVDDVATHVEGAVAAGWDAVQYTTTPKLVAELRQRGIEFNY